MCILKIFSPNPSPGLVAFDSPTHVSHSGEYTSDSALNNASDLSIPTSPSPGGGISHNGCPTNGRQDCSLMEVHAYSSESSTALLRIPYTTADRHTLAKLYPGS